MLTLCLLFCCTFLIELCFKDPFAESNAGGPPAYRDTFADDNASRYDTEMMGFLSDCALNVFKIKL